MSPASLPRLLVIMGSGETSPTMVTTHRRLVERMGPAPVPAVLLDTPFGFQANADLLAQRAVQYFAHSVGLELEVATWRSAAAAGTVEGERSLARLRAAAYVFAGPGSPSYALRQWAGSAVPEVLATKLDRGGCVTFASAAALTLGSFTVPVYEIYKVGEELRWLQGLDLLSRAGMPGVAVIPHYDNAEGGNHDTRYCYLGEHRLMAMEEQLPDEGLVVGVDEHTGVVFDLDGRCATVVGRGGLTLRRRGASEVIPTGTTVGLDDLRHACSGGHQVGSRPAGNPGVVAQRGGAGGAGGDVEAPASLAEAVSQLEQRFDEAVSDRQVDGAVAAVLDLDAAIVIWSHDTLESDQADTARSVLRTMVVRLGELAEAGAVDPEDTVRPFVDALLQVRADARRARDWGAADAVRDRLLAAGVEINDAPEGTSWRLLS